MYNLIKNLISHLFYILRRGLAPPDPLEAVAMKWIDDLKESAAAFRDWGRLLTIVGFVMAGSLVVIAAELFVICLKI